MASGLKKLQIRSETMRELRSEELGRVAGGEGGEPGVWATTQLDGNCANAALPSKQATCCINSCGEIDPE